MQEQMALLDSWSAAHGQLAMWLGLVILLSLSWLANFIVKHILLRSVFKLLGLQKSQCEQRGLDFSFISRLANVVPALVISTLIHKIPLLPTLLVQVVVNVTNAFVVLTIAMALSKLLTLVNSLYSRREDAKSKPIKGYIQLLKIVIYAVAVILMIAALFDRSPLILLSGLGAMAAVLMLIFQDTLLSLVASVQISSNDVIRVGDWVEMPQLNADGDVIDIALHTVKIQNWDRTITTIPTRRFMTDPFKNWRGMQQSGGRRIKRSLQLDQQSVRFLTTDEINRLKRFRLLKQYLDEKEAEIRDWNQQLAEQGQEPVNTRRITNLGTFRAYVLRYLQSHAGVHQGMIQMVRQLAPSADGLPLEIYCFTNTTAWVNYEGIQSDIFDHLLAILPEFGLQVYQHPSGMDMRSWQNALSAP
ncbi:mechanosensitive ion channel family protein [Alishewanella jeotgali]|uniref:Mechanosensitive ion channel family protein n=1 Tax=Alishewanella jeotgali KCTC 22429 TaxID=1129374 RepID=H3ZGM9_9ALTE|nr:mechanosensitive ion channel family protein [Alishewanella jeotgali]EHR40283.1 mechanosensitive ion channel family protein [Alishewanella jeotgali KCTC 22429]